jgi:hypothetical protein
MEQVMDSARRVNQVMTKGNYGTQAQRYWAALRANINDLARCVYQELSARICLFWHVPAMAHTSLVTTSTKFQAEGLF